MEHKSAARRQFAGGRFLLEPNVTDAEILTMVDRLERCLLGKEEFHHRDHLTVAVVYLYSADMETAMSRMRAALKRFAAHHQVSKLYHETLTRFWLQEVEQGLNRGVCLEQSVRQAQARLGDKNLVFDYYTRERINSQEAREKWLPPDLKPV